MSDDAAQRRIDRLLKTHLSITRPNRFGGSTTSSLCGRFREVAGGMNLVGITSDVNCKFCLRLIAAHKGKASLVGALIAPRK